MTLCLHDLALAAGWASHTRGLTDGACTHCADSRTEDLSAQEQTVPGSPTIQLPTALSTNLLLSILGLRRVIWKLSVRDFLHKAASALPPCLSRHSNHQQTNRLNTRTSRETRLVISPYSITTTSHSLVNTHFSTNHPQDIQAGFLGSPIITLHHDALSKTISTSSLPRPSAESAFAPSSKERLRVAG